jgi:hypothetical protein
MKHKFLNTISIILIMFPLAIMWKSVSEGGHWFLSIVCPLGLVGYIFFMRALCILEEDIIKINQEESTNEND